jgi:hypothetical protein
MKDRHHPHPDWNQIDRSALGLIYGSILVLSQLMALEESNDSPLRPGLILMGSIFAVTLAKAFSELVAHSVESHEKVLKASAWRAAWRHSRATLTVANVPTLLLLGAGLKGIEFSTAVFASQVFCVAVLALIGARLGWAIRPRSWLSWGGAGFVGGIGAALAALKYILH